jgi:hypothetical protein
MVEIGEGQALVSRNNPLRLRIERAKGTKEGWKGGWEIGDDCSALLVLAYNQSAAGSDDPAEHVVELEVELRGHANSPTSNSFAFAVRNLMRRCP